MVEDGSLDTLIGSTARRCVGPLQLPRVAALVVQQARVVVALVEVLENRRKNFGLVIGQGDALASGGGRAGGGGSGRR